ncbi:hypothetical protein N8I77_011427 [Diaporthe amygdali]|uniref:Major facilitator superfamily (MFS) profile domain-containing protein n=1 Tax=Phomopsis amygdali TaxID=1214568 RepID=A0AAD9S5E1_PHOAM|nr:hypothetical protein N8I77_011427 [Diaporthe amygdali]
MASPNHKVEDGHHVPPDGKGTFELNEDGKSPVPALKLDKHGLPLVPQPSNHKDDPLNWSPAWKLAVLLQISLLALIGPMAAAVINPAFVPLGKAFGISPVAASYELTMYIIFAGVGPLLIVPFANVYGRRPIYLGGNLLAAIANLVAGNCSTWGGLLATRAFSGIGAGSTVAIGAATICDLYFLHQRGFFMGIFTFFLTNGPHLAPLIGGFTAQNLGWRYCFTIPSYIQFALFAITLFCLPETLYSRQTEAEPTEYHESSYRDLLLFRPKHPSRKLRLVDFTRPFTMLKYVCVLLPALYYMTAFSFGTVLFASTGSVVFRTFYHFNLVQTGLILSIPLLIGSLIGEANAGWFVDFLIYKHSQRHDGRRPPEPRLDALWLALLLPIGTIIQGVCISHSATTSWVGNAFGMGIANFGLQVSTTVVYSYTTDCYKPQSAEISSILNLFRSIFSAFVSFYAIPLGEMIQFQYAWLVFAFLTFAFILPVGMLRLNGEKIRATNWQKPPTFHNDL